MEQHLPMSLQVTLYTASLAIAVLAGVVVRVLLRLTRQLDRMVVAVERFEAELTPLARESRMAVDRLRDLSDRSTSALDAAIGLVLGPVQFAHRAAGLLRTGAAAFLGALWSGRARPQRKAKAS